MLFDAERKADELHGQILHLIAKVEQLRDQRDAALRVKDGLRNDFVRASDALMTNTSKLVTSEREAEKLRAELSERDAKIERLREIFERVSTKVDAVGQLAAELEFQVAGVNMPATRGDA